MLIECNGVTFEQREYILNVKYDLTIYLIEG